MVVHHMLWTLGMAALCATAAAAQKEAPVFRVFPIGTVERRGGKTYLELHEKYAPGLRGLDGFSHVVVLYWFDRNDTPEKRSILQVHPRGNPKNPLTGVFATRAPVRPNLIALSVCRIVEVGKSRVRVDRIDAFDHTPIVDLKPFIPADNPTQDVRTPRWAPRPGPRPAPADDARRGNGPRH